MICEICHESEASLHFKQVIDGEVREMHICAECAAEHGVEIQASPLSVTDFLFGMGGERLDTGNDKQACSGCGWTRAECRKRARFGCAKCYESFPDEVSAILPAMHRGTRHVGKVPAAAKRQEEIASMERALLKAVERQDFEEAATLRDRIQIMKDVPGVAVPGVPDEG